MNKYRVIVLREGDSTDETLFEIAGPASLVQHVVPGALDAVLSGSEVGATSERSLADRVFDAAVAAGTDAERQQDEADEAAGKPKRNRRTKAQIAADKEAQALGFRDAAHRAEVESQQQASVTTTTALAGAVPVPAEAPSGLVPPASPVPPADAPSGVAPPWNPFTNS